MEKILLNGLNMNSKELAHDELARALSLPEFYGRNLDALYDLASTMTADVLLTDADAMTAALGTYGQALIDTLNDAAQANPHFHFEMKA